MPIDGAKISFEHDVALEVGRGDGGKAVRVQPLQTVHVLISCDFSTASVRRTHERTFA